MQFKTDICSYVISNNNWKYCLLWFHRNRVVKKYRLWNILFNGIRNLGIWVNMYTNIRLNSSPTFMFAYFNQNVEASITLYEIPLLLFIFIGFNQTGREISCTRTEFLLQLEISAGRAVMLLNLVCGCMLLNVVCTFNKKFRRREQDNKIEILETEIFFTFFVVSFCLLKLGENE